MILIVGAYTRQIYKNRNVERLQLSGRTNP